MSWCADRRPAAFRSDHGADVREGITPSGHYGYGWIVRRGDGTCDGFSAEWVDDRQQWVLWTNPTGTGWSARDVDWPPPGDGGRIGVVRERAGGDA